MADRLLLRRDTSANWSANNPILGTGEPGYETDTKRLKFGDGLTPWQSLPYFGSGGTILLDWSYVTGKPLTYPPEAHTHTTAQILTDSENRFVSDAEKIVWTNKLSPTDTIDCGTW